MRAILLFCPAWLLLVTCAVACPFCTAVKPTLAQQFDEATIVALGEVTGNEGTQHVFRLLKVFKGQDRLAGAKSLTLAADVPANSAGMQLMIASGQESAAPTLMQWTCTSVDETSAAYVAKLPDLHTPNAQRLRYFAPRLEHVNPFIAEDVFLEFGHATLDDVTQAADQLPMEKLRAWINDPAIPPGRKGFYGLALGLATTKADRDTNRDLLRQQILAPATDFRAGFDGLLAGFLLLSADAGIQLIDERYFANPQSADGDVRHALSAVRFYHEFGHDAPAERLAAAVRHLLARPEFAATVIADLARWQDWGALDQIAALYKQKQYDDGPTRRAIVGYLRACPQSRANEALARLRQVDPQGIAEAEQQLPPAATEK